MSDILHFSPSVAHTCHYSIYMHIFIHTPIYTQKMQTKLAAAIAIAASGTTVTIVRSETSPAVEALHGNIATRATLVVRDQNRTKQE